MQTTAIQPHRSL